MSEPLVKTWTSEVDGLCIETVITPKANGYNAVRSRVVEEASSFD